MPLTLKSLREQQATMEIVYFDEQATLTYRPNLITEEMIGRFAEIDKQTKARQKAVDAGEEAPEMDVSQLDVLNDVLAEVCVSWDVLDDDGEMVPFTPPALRKLPIPFKQAVFQQIIEDYAGNQKTSSARSGAGSARKGR